MSKISEARAIYKAEAAKIGAELAQQQLDREAPYRAAVVAAVVEAYTSGESISAICREYGTTARVTILNLLRDAGVYTPTMYRGTR